MKPPYLEFERALKGGWLGFPGSGHSWLSRLYGKSPALAQVIRDIWSTSAGARLQAETNSFMW